MKNKKNLNRFANLLFVVLLIIIIPLSVPRFFGFSTLSVLSESMEPSIPTGSIIYVKAIEVEKLKIDDVITFHAQQNKIVTHRIVDIKNKAFITKGDHNTDVDMSSVRYSQIIGKVQFSVPLFGYILQFCSSIVGISMILVILFAIMGIWKYCRSVDK